MSLRRARLAWLLLLGPGPVLAAAPVLSGLYRVGSLGVVDFSMQEGRVIGRLKVALGCQVPADTQVLTGSFEGTAFAGEILLCQDGPSCGDKKYPFLGIHHDDEVVARVKLDTGCHSPGLDDASLKIVPASMEEKKKALEGGGSAAAVAAKNSTNKKTAEDLVLEALKSGQQALDQGDYAAARDAFARATSYDDSKWYLHFGLGVARLHLSDPTGARESIERALALALKGKEGPDTLAQLHYNLACTNLALGKKNEAMQSLRAMARLPPVPDIVDHLNTDTDLAALRDDPEFRKLVAELRVAREKTRKPR